MSMTMILLTVSVGCNLWFLCLLLYDRIMETRFVRFLKGIAGLWRSLGGTEGKQDGHQKQQRQEQQKQNAPGLIFAIVRQLVLTHQW